jgi:hypothetical protein
MLTLPLFGQFGKRLVQSLPLPDLPAVDQFRLRHAAVRDHLIEQADANTDVLGGLRAGQAKADVRLYKKSPRGNSR